MRTPPNDDRLIPDTTEREPREPERRCVVSGVTGAREDMLRLAIAPDGAVLPDVRAAAPGRGAWLNVDRATLESALAKGKLKGALARAFKGAPLSIPDDLPARIDAAFEREALALLGMAARSGVLLLGADRIDTAARGGEVHWLAHAADAADDGRRKRDQSWRVGLDEEGSGRQGDVLPLGRDALSVALGRENAVHLALTDRGWAERAVRLFARWRAFRGCATGGDAEQQILGSTEPLEVSSSPESAGGEAAAV